MSELIKALNKARADVRATIFKKSVNEHQQYAYVSHEDVMTSGSREALIANGLVLIQTVVEFVSEIPAGRNKALLWRGEYLLKHESGEELKLVYMATTQQNDKSAYVASTGLDKEAFQRVMQQTGSSEEDPDHDVHDRRTSNNNQGNQPQKQPDPFVGGLMDKLRQATPETLDALVNDANMLRPSLAPDERAAMRTAVEFARAKVAQILEERKMVQEQSQPS